MMATSVAERFLWIPKFLRVGLTNMPVKKLLKEPFCDVYLVGHVVQYSTGDTIKHVCLPTYLSTYIQADTHT